MRIKIGSLVFKPMLGLSVVVLICMGILATLGTWQYKRLIWKTDLIVHINQAANADPLTSLAQANDVQKSGDPLDFRRIELDGAFLKPQINNGQPFHLMRSDGKRLLWRHYQPFQQPFKDGDITVYVATHKFEDRQKMTPPDMETGPSIIVGYVRIPDMATRFMPKNNPDKNRWFVFNASPELLDWAGPENDLGGDIETAYFIDQVFGVKTAADIPVKIPEIMNNHLDYMLTWYSFMLILLVIYLLLHKRAGRLYIERP
ncbi:MAG: hypothetical protein COA91_05595 [Robiginitomaculum sp.]|nr:MAG: hypothetical protein COA91_05595 [Robiginitomaculum sp.]